MAWTYDQLIAEMHTQHDWAQTYLFWARNHFEDADFHWQALDDHEAIEDILLGVYDNNQAIERVAWGGYWGYNGSTNIIPTALDRNMACPFIDEAPEYELTMANLIQTMLTADPDEVRYFVGLVDAYRQSVWNKPFNTEFYAALARGFELWP